MKCSNENLNMRRKIFASFGDLLILNFRSRGTSQVDTNKKTKSKLFGRKQDDKDSINFVLKRNAKSLNDIVE